MVDVEISLTYFIVTLCRLKKHGERVLQSNILYLELEVQLTLLSDVSE